MMKLSSKNLLDSPDLDKKGDFSFDSNDSSPENIKERNPGIYKTMPDLPFELKPNKCNTDDKKDENDDKNNVKTDNKTNQNENNEQNDSPEQNVVRPFRGKFKTAKTLKQVFKGGIVPISSTEKNDISGDHTDNVINYRRKSTILEVLQVRSSTLNIVEEEKHDDKHDEK